MSREPPPRNIRIQSEETEPKRDVSETDALEMLNTGQEPFELKPERLSRLAKSDSRKRLIAGQPRCHTPVNVRRTIDQLVVGHFPL
jgi:hypothetical protein